MPIIGIQASSYRNLAVSSYESIQTYSVSSATTVVEFSSIPATYKHLELRLYARSGRSRDVNSGLAMRINSNYTTYGSYTEVYNTGAPTSYSGGPSTIEGSSIQVPGLSSNANAFGIAVIRFIDYANTNKFKSFFLFNGAYTSTPQGAYVTNTGYFNTTSAIDSIAFQTTDGGASNIQVGSVFALYGIKG